jgi:hypothetical protein
MYTVIESKKRAANEIAAPFINICDLLNLVHYYTGHDLRIGKHFSIHSKLIKATLP